MKRFIILVLLNLLLAVLAFGQLNIEKKESGIPSLVRYGVGKIAFRDTVGFSGLFSMEQDRTNYTSLFAEYGSFPIYSRDGSKILYTYIGDVFLANSDGTNRIQISPVGLPSELGCDISPDNSKVLMTHDGNGIQKIYQANSDGTNVIPLATGVQTDSQPKYSPDGSKIVFARKTGSGQEQSIYVMNSNGSNIIRLTNTPQVLDKSPSFSYDGTKIVFNRHLNLGSGDSPIIMINADGSNPLTIKNGLNFYVSFSPDDKYLLYLVNNPATQWTTIHTRNLETGEDRLIHGVGSGIDRVSWQSYLITKNIPFDFDGDRKADFAIYRNVSERGNWMLSRSSTNAFYAAQFGLPSDKIVPADYDGDGKTDTAVFRPSEGNWYRINSATGSFYALNFGTAGDIPVPADYDGDFKTDFAVYRPSEGNWYRLNSFNGQFVVSRFGTAEDKPLIGDFDGDGKADIAVFRPSEGIWYILNSSNNQFISVNFGISTDLPVPADYDGDGKTDISVFRDGIWFRLNSSDGSFTAFAYGIAADKPVPADYDGDGKADIGVFRQSIGYWYIFSSSNGAMQQHFGTSGDIPTPNAFVR